MTQTAKIIIIIKKNNKAIKITAELLFKKPNTIQQRTENGYHSQCMQAGDVKSFFKKMQHKIN